MDLTQQLLQVSAKLYQHITNLPADNEREKYIEKINSLLDERGHFMEALKREGFQYDSSNKAHAMLSELDKGIRDRLNKVLDSIRLDLKDLQNSKKSERQYINPYANIEVMDGRYYDRKK
jgi:flagellar protein FliT